jgi:hypothetical protein
MFKILAVHCSTSGLNPYGRVLDASVKIHGYGVLVTLRAGQVPLPSNATVRSKNRQEAVLAFTDRFPITALNIDSAFVCLLGFTWTHTERNPPAVRHYVSALLLKSLGVTGNYERAGCLPYLNNDQSWFDDAEEMDFTIV